MCRFKLRLYPTGMKPLAGRKKKMSINKEKYQQILEELNNRATLIAVSKTKTKEDILELYNLGQRDFGENYVQELSEKYTALPKDIRWHFIGHLQTNKVKFIAAFITLVHGVDSFALLKEINKQGLKNNRTINCLLQVHIAKEETKFGLDEKELEELITRIKTNLPAKGGIDELKNVEITGLMGMASFSDDMELIRKEFKYLKNLFDNNAQPPTLSDKPIRAGSNFQPTTLSMGMSSDYQIALEEGSNMVRIGSLIFGARNNKE